MQKTLVTQVFISYVQAPLQQTMYMPEVLIRSLITHGVPLSFVISIIVNEEGKN